ncbi:retrovirus-related pol polyprotein from transposon TNT 1-94 [Tanacetum coccineum]
MSNSNTNLQTKSSNALYNAIMEAGSKDRPPMLAPGNYVQWKSRIKRYIDTKPNSELIHHCLQNPPYTYQWAEKIVPVAEGSSETTTEGYMENYKNVSQDIRDQLNVEAEAVQIILTGIDNDIYSTVDACPNACEISQQATRNRGKAIVNSSAPIYDQEPVTVTEEDEMSKEREIDKLMALISLSFKKIYKPTNNNLRTSSNTSRANQDNSPRINRETGYDNQRVVNVAGARENVGTQIMQKSGIQYYYCKEYGHVSRECQKPKRVKEATYHKEKMLLCKQKEAGIQLNAEQADWKDDTDDESDDQELEAHYMYMAQIQEVTPDAVKNSRPVFDAEPLHKDDQDDIDELDQERDLLASLIDKLKCEIDDSKNRNKFLESSHKALVDKLKDLKKFQAELDKYHDVNYASKINDLNQTISDLKKELVAHQETISTMSQEKEAQIKLYKTREDKELDKVIALENKVKEMVADLRYFNSLEHEVDTLKSQLETQKTQFLNEIDRLSREYYYADHMNAILGVYTDIDEVSNLQCDYLETLEKCEHLEKELSKSRTMSKSFEALQKHAINLELDLQQCKEKIKNDKSFKENQSNVFLKEREQYFEIQDLKAQLQDKGIAISELKKLIEKMKGKSVETKFEKSSVIRQPNAFKSQRQSVLGKPAIFSDSLEKKDFSKSKSVTKNNVSNDFSKPVTAQILPQNIKSILKNTNVIAPGMYKVHTEPNQTRTPQLPQDIRKTNKRVSFSTGVIPTTSVSRPQLKSNRMGDRVLPNNSQGKKQEVEDHRRNFKFSNNKTSVTACNDSLNAKTLNVNFVCVTCGKYVLNNNHDMCVLHYINGVNSRTRQPIAVPISTREPKQTVNQSVATSHKKTVATDSTVKKPRNIIRKIYEQVSKTCSWWYPKITPPGYKWKPKSPTGKVNPNVSMPLGNASRTANILEHMTPRRSTISNTPLSSNSFAACTVKFRNDQIAPILGYGDLVQGTITIKRVYYFKGLNHNLFSVGQFCDADLDVAFRKSTCYIRDLKGNDLLTGSRRTDLYSITLQDITIPNPICLMAKATSSQAWLWHCRLSHLNFDTINLLSKNNIVTSLPKLKFIKDHLCSSCELGKAKESLFTLRLPRVPKDEGIRHETSTARTPEQNDVVERRNRTLVDVARTMLSAAKVPLFFWAEAIATACFTQSRSLVIPRHEKTPYHIINGRKSLVKFFHIFGSLCYIVRDGENLDKMKEKMESDHVSSDLVSQCSTTVLEQDSLSPDPQSQENVTQTAETVTTSNELDLLFSPMFDELLNGTTLVVSKSSAIHAADAPDKHQHQNISHSSTTSVVAAEPPLNIHTTPQTTNQAPTYLPTVTAPENIIQAETNTECAQVDDDESINIFSTPVQERGETSSRHVDSSNMHTFYQHHPSGQR